MDTENTLRDQIIKLSHDRDQLQQMIINEMNPNLIKTFEKALQEVHEDADKVYEKLQKVKKTNRKKMVE